jgi:predicted TIM-barrel fold metal-dependent hydrolase
MSVSEIIEHMDEYGIKTMVNMEEPCTIFTNVDPSQVGIPSLSEKYPDRFISLYSGEAATMLDRVAASGSYTKTDEEKYTTLLEDAMKSGKYRGFGEIALCHGFITSLGTGGNTGCANVIVPSDHPWMFIMSDIAAKYDVPIDIHMEKPAEMLPGFERLLDHNRNTTIIWSHTGWNVEEYSTPEIWRQLLEKHPNLYGSIKCRPFMSSELVSLVLEDKTINTKWLELFKEFPDRFMIGSDIKPGQRGGEFNYIPSHLMVLKSLPRDVQNKIARGNAQRIFKL